MCSQFKSSEEFLCNSTSSIQTSRRKKKNSSEILNCGHITYSVNTLKIEYLSPDFL